MRIRRVIGVGVLAAALVVAAAGGRGVPRAAASGLAVVDAALRDALASAAEPVEAIVAFAGDGAPTVAQVDLLRQVGVAQGVTFQSLPMAGVLVTAAQVEALAAAPGVRSVWLNRRLTYYNAEATALTGVDRVRTDATMTFRNGGMPVSGRGVGVVINDSGVEGTHQDIAYGTHLVQNVLGSTNLHTTADLLPVSYVEGVPSTDPNSGHGTHVAGIVGGTGAMSAGKYEGVAPGASLIGYGSGAALFILDGLGGFDYALTHQFQYDIRVITNSWGSTGEFDPADPINIASYLAYKRNIVTLFAAGNEGPAPDTHNPYAKAPWVISVAAGDKQGNLADFSSRGVKGRGGSFTMDGEVWAWEDRPTITAPGVDIISTRAVAPVSSLAATDDVNVIEPGYLPYYTLMSGTSMATPHVAGIAALMLEANPRLTPADVKAILQQTATNMPGREAWEAGAGYVNAYAAVDRSYRQAGYGSTLNLGRMFNSSATGTTTVQSFSIQYNPLTLSSANQLPFTVPAGVSVLNARVMATGILGQTGNPVNLILHAPDGSTYSSGISLLFPLYLDRTVQVASPRPGTWTVELKGLRYTEANPTDGVAFPETVSGTLEFQAITAFTGLSDIAGHPAADAIWSGVSRHLFDGYPDGTFRPNDALTRIDLARYLVMGAQVRQYLPLDGSVTFGDVAAADRPYAEAAATRGAALRDRAQTARGVVLPTGAGTFAAGAAVRRADLAYSLVQSLGLEAEALARNGSNLTVQYGDSRIAIDDAGEIPAGLRGYVQLALDLNILNAYFSVTQGPYDLVPAVHAVFHPQQTVTRGDFAVAMTRFDATYM